MCLSLVMLSEICRCIMFQCMEYAYQFSNLNSNKNPARALPEQPETAQHWRAALEQPDLNKWLRLLRLTRLTQETNSLSQQRKVRSDMMCWNCSLKHAVSRLVALLWLVLKHFLNGNGTRFQTSSRTHSSSMDQMFAKRIWIKPQSMKCENQQGWCQGAGPL